MESLGGLKIQTMLGIENRKRSGSPIMDNSVSSNGFSGSFAGSVPVVTNSTPPPAAETVSRSSPRQRLLAALTGLLPRNLRALSVTAFLALLAASLLFLLPGGPVWAQDAETIEYAENRTDPVATYTAVDPEQTEIVSWTLAGTDAGVFDIAGGVLTFKNSPDFEDPKGGGIDGNLNTYSVTVQATDETNKVGTEDVTVEVTNVDEPGAVTLSALQPQSAVVLTATHTDPDDSISDLKWQWAKADSKSGAYADIDDKATADVYTPVDDDLGAYLRATASYTDKEGSGKSAMVVSEYAVQAVRGINTAPKFADDQDPVMDDNQEDAARTVAENTKAGQAIGNPVVAEDKDGDVLTYTLEGAGAGDFAIDWATGQIMTKSPLNAEGTTTYTVTVRATDPAGIPQADPAVPANSDTVTVNIIVTDVNEAPDVTGDEEVSLP